MTATWLPPAQPLSPDAARRIGDVLHEHAEAYCTGVAEVMRFWPFFSETPTPASELRNQVTALRKLIDKLTPILELDAFPYLVRETMLIVDGVQDPHAFIADLWERLRLVRDAADRVCDQFPKLKRGKRHQPGHDWLDAQLLALYAKVTHKRATSVEAAACAAIVHEAVGGRSADADAVQRRDRRRRTRLKTSPLA